MAQAMLNEMTGDSSMAVTSPASRKKVLVVGVDFSEYGDAALRNACELARLQADATLNVVHVVPLRAAMGQDDVLVTSLPDIDHLNQQLSHHVAVTLDALGDGLPQVVTHLGVGDPARE